MAFVPSLSLRQTLSQPLSTSSYHGDNVSVTPLSTPLRTPRMGYGDYSLSTDKTKGHVNQYYVDKFRIPADFAKGSPATAADAVLGCNVKNQRLVPKEGIPQVFDDPIPAPVSDVVPDPRIAESEGAVYPWDVNYVDPQYLPSAYSDCNDEGVAEKAFAEFRSSLAMERGSMLTAMDFGAAYRVNRIKDGLDEKYLLCLDGALDANYARLQKIADPPTFTPTGAPQTEIPGFPYMGSVGAMDFQEKPGESIATWNDTPGMGVEQKTFKRPSGSNTPSLPYNTSPTVDQMIEAQEARNILEQAE